jgi:hypothetical protein
MPLEVCHAAVAHSAILAGALEQGPAVCCPCCWRVAMGIGPEESA